MKKNYYPLLLLLVSLQLFTPALRAQVPVTVFEKSGGKETPTYYEIIDWWSKVDKASPLVTLKTMGPSDAGFPLHLVLVNKKGLTDINAIRKSGSRILLVNNGIHPGEPDGIDASMLLVKEILNGKLRLPENVSLAIIPVYNIGGCLNRSEYIRVDQNGPRAFGSRGNSQYLDLNRDFIKADSKEAQSFAEIFRLTDPDVFMDNHVSNGADYQHVMTLLTSQPDKLGGPMGEYLRNTIDPALKRGMKDKGFFMVPYVNFFGSNPENGWPGFYDSPRYSSGFATLWQTFAFVPETHMLKAYDQRVKATHDLMATMIDFLSTHSAEISRLREEAKEAVISQKEFALRWSVDREKFSEIDFLGYEVSRIPSEVSGLPRTYYDRNKPYEKKIKYYNYFKATVTIQKPDAYILPQGWWRVIAQLKNNGVKMRALSKDTTLEVEVYRIEEYQSSQRPYEFHHPNSNVKVSVSKQKMSFRKGDWYIPMNQRANRYLVETLEPQAEDSYFYWNYFDGILGQKEGYSDYAFEETAAQMLKENPALRQELETARGKDSTLRKSAGGQLDFIYKRSPYYEPDHLRYPVFRVVR